MPDRLTAPPGAEDDFDYSSPEAEAAIRAAHALVLEVARPLARKVTLYERTLGLAVVPVLLRRAIIAGWSRNPATALRDALDRPSSDPSESERRGRLGRRIVADEYGHDRYLDSMVGLYQSVVARHRPSDMAESAP